MVVDEDGCGCLVDVLELVDNGGGLAREEKMPADRVGLGLGVEKGSSNLAAFVGVAKDGGAIPDPLSRTLRGVRIRSSSELDADSFGD